MTINDHVNKLLVSSGLPLDTEFISSVNNVCTYKLKGTKLPLPIEIKQTISRTAYADNLIDESGNNAVEFLLKELKLSSSMVNCYVKFTYTDVNEYEILYNVLSTIRFDQLGNKYYE